MILTSIQQHHNLQEGSPGPPGGGFQTAKAALFTKLRKKSGGFDPQQWSSGNMFPDLESTGAVTKQTPPGGGRATSGGASRPVLSGLRKPPVPSGLT